MSEDAMAVVLEPAPVGTAIPGLCMKVVNGSRVLV